MTPDRRQVLLSGVAAASLATPVAALAERVVGRAPDFVARLSDGILQVSALSARVHELEATLADELLARPGRRVFAAGAEGDVISLRTGERAKKANQLVVWRPFGSRG